MHGLRKAWFCAAVGMLLSAYGARGGSTYTWNGSTGNWSDSRWAAGTLFGQTLYAVPTPGATANINSGVVTEDYFGASVGQLNVGTGGRLVQSDIASAFQSPNVSISGGSVVRSGGWFAVDNTTDVFLAGVPGGLYVAYDGTSSLSVTNGGTLSSSSSDPAIYNVGGLAVGGLAGANGTVLVSDPGSTLSLSGTAGGATIGLYGNGALTVRNGAQFNSQGGIIGSGQLPNYSMLVAGSGTVTVTGAGSAWNSSNGIDLGEYQQGAGTLNVSAGGVVTASRMSVARVAGSSGTISLSGAGTHLNILGTGTGDGTLHIGGGPGDSGALAAGGTATITVASGAALRATQRIDIWNHGVLQFNGGAIQTSALSLIGGGQLLFAPGADKSLSLTSLTLDAANGSRIDLADNSIVIQGAGAASLLPSIQADLNQGRAGGIWLGNGITSSSAAADPSHLALGYALESSGADPSTDQLLIMLAHIGDANLDGKVDGADLELLARNFGSGTGWAAGDFNYDGKVDGADLALVESNFGYGTGETFAQVAAQLATDLSQYSQLSSTPEPAGAVGLLLVTMGFVLGRRPRYHRA